MAVVTTSYLNLETFSIETKNMIVEPNQKINVNKYKNSLYDAVYDALTRLRNSYTSLPKGRFSTNINIQNVAINNELIIADLNHVELKGRQQKDVVYYKISPKGLRFIELYVLIHDMVGKKKRHD